jgi:hypothetical protein
VYSRAAAFTSACSLGLPFGFPLDPLRLDKLEQVLRQSLSPQRFEAFSDFVYRCRFGGVHSYRAQTPPCHRRHLRTARRVWRTVVLATQTPLTRVLPGPHAAATCMTMPSGWGIGAGVIACAEVARAKAKPATAINLIILLLLFYRESVTQTPTGAQTRSGSCESFVNCEAARIAYYCAIRT